MSNKKINKNKIKYWFASSSLIIFFCLIVGIVSGGLLYIAVTLYGIKNVVLFALILLLLSCLVKFISWCLEICDEYEESSVIDDEKNSVIEDKEDK